MKKKDKTDRRYCLGGGGAPEGACVGGGINSSDLSNREIGAYYEKKSIDSCRE